MKKIVLLAALFGGMLSATIATGADCNGNWNILPNNNPSIAPCKQLGLDSRRGICQPGQPYETLCDDAKGGRYRVCQGARPCGGHSVAPPQPVQQQSCNSWDYSYNQPCPPGYVNYDCRGGCEPAR